MANVKISQLPAASTVSASSDVLPMVHSGVTVKATPNQIVQEVLKNPGAIGAVVPSSASFNALTLTGSLTAGGSPGTSGQVLESTGTGVQWTSATGGMVYPGAGVPVSTGSAWGTSKTTPAGDLVGTSDAQTLTAKTISGASNTLSNIGNAALTNSSITINGSTVSLGGSTTVSASTTNALTIGTGLSGTSFNGGTAVTIAIDSTVATLTGSQVLTNKTISGSSNTLSNIANASLTNSAITFGATAQALGSTVSSLSGVSISGAAGSFTTLGATGNVTLGDASTDTLTINGTAVSIPNNLNFDSNTLFIDAANNRIGVGTAAPATRLHTTGTAAGSPDTTGSGVTGVSVRFQCESVNFDFGTYNSGACWIQPRLANDNSYVFNTVLNPVGGNVGIGLAVPTSKLDVAGGNVAFRQSSNAANTSVSFNTTVQNALTLDASGNLFLAGYVNATTYYATVNANVVARLGQYSNINAGSSAYTTFDIGNDTGVAALEFLVLSSTNTTYAGPNSGAIIAGYGNLLFQTQLNGTDIRFATVGTERMRLDPTGNAQFLGGLVMPGQQAQTSKAAAATLTGAELITGILQYTGAAATVTLPTGTTIEGALTWSATNVSLDWYVINTGSGTCTIGANSNTTVGALTVAAAASAHFRIRRTATNTFTVYRVS